jgi:hypothetical protein
MPSLSRPRRTAGGRLAVAGLRNLSFMNQSSWAA